VLTQSQPEFAKLVVLSQGIRWLLPPAGAAGSKHLPGARHAGYMWVCTPTMLARRPTALAAKALEGFPGRPQPEWHLGPGGLAGNRAVAHDHARRHHCGAL
jgi:hypothetical protein